MRRPKEREEIINRLIRRFAYQSYLEIGTEDGITLGRIQIAEKTAVDPHPLCSGVLPISSDAFFENNTRFFDIVFIDGLHTAAQCHRDIINAVKHLNPNGSIVVHDCIPLNEQEQHPVRAPGQDLWTGDVWRAFLKAAQDPDLSTVLFDADHGCGVIRRRNPAPPTVQPSGENVPPARGFPADRDPLAPDQVSWQEYNLNMRHWLRVHPASMIGEVIDKLT